MFRVACVSGGLLAGASEPDIASLRAYGEALGVTFQIVDDILDEMCIRDRCFACPPPPCSA